MDNNPPPMVDSAVPVPACGTTATDVMAGGAGVTATTALACFSAVQYCAVHDACCASTASATPPSGAALVQLGYDTVRGFSGP